MRKMHKDEIETNQDQVRRLLAAQFPQWAGLPVEPVPSSGTDNAIYRLGQELAVRLPRIHWATGQIEKEFHWLPRLAPHLPYKLPTQLAQGQPAEGYPYTWAIYRWLDGESARLEALANPRQAARDLAGFLAALRQVNTSGGPLVAPGSSMRGGALRMRDAETRAAIYAMRGMLDTQAALAVWEAALAAPAWAQAPVWFHGDLLPGNLLVKDGHICAVIDFSCLGVGDPAIDLLPAWSLFEGESRAAFRAALAVDDATWLRGKGLALSIAVIYIPYYLESNPAGVAMARRMLDAVLSSGD